MRSKKKKKEEEEEEDKERDRLPHGEDDNKMTGQQGEDDNKMTDQQGDDENKMTEDEKKKKMSEGEKRKKAAPKIEKLRVTKKRPASMMEEKEAVKAGNPMVEGLEFGRALTGKNIRCYIMAKLKGGLKSHLVHVSAKEALNYVTMRP